MDLTTAVVVVTVVSLVVALVAFAVVQTGCVKAGGNLGAGSFFFEAKRRLK